MERGHGKSVRDANGGELDYIENQNGLQAQN